MNRIKNWHLIIILIGLCFILTYTGYKRYQPQINTIKTVFLPKTPPPTNPKPEKNDYMQIVYERITLIAVINNHNAVVLRDGLSKSEIMVINEDWTIDKIPSTLSNVGDAEKQFLNKFLRKK